MPEPVLDGTTEDVSEATLVPQEQSAEDRLLEEDLLIEDVSIDGMCGVY